MREGSEDLSPDDAKVSQVAVGDLREDAVEHVTQEMATETCHYRFATTIAGEESVRDRGKVVRDSQVVKESTEAIRHRDLYEQPHSGHGVRS